MTFDILEHPTTRRASYVTTLLLVLFCATLLTSCREKLSAPGDVPPSQQTQLRFVPGDYYSYDNWLLDANGRKIGSSYFRNSWTVLDTGSIMLGTSRVILIIDSTFSTVGLFTRRDSIYLKVSENGDVFQYGFVRRLIAARESLNVPPSWDRIAAFALPLGQPWTMARVDTSGEGGNVDVIGRILPLQEYLGVNVNGVHRAVLAYRVRVTKVKLDYSFWITDAPSAIIRAIDESPILRNVTLRELARVSTRQN